MGLIPLGAHYYDLFGPGLFVVVAWQAGKKAVLDGVEARGREFSRGARILLKRDCIPPLHCQHLGYVGGTLANFSGWAPKDGPLRLAGRPQLLAAASRGRRANVSGG